MHWNHLQRATALNETKLMQPAIIMWNYGQDCWLVKVQQSYFCNKCVIISVPCVYSISLRSVCISMTLCAEQLWKVCQHFY